MTEHIHTRKYLLCILNYHITEYVIHHNIALLVGQADYKGELLVDDRQVCISTVYQLHCLIKVACFILITVECRCEVDNSYVVCFTRTADSQFIGAHGTDVSVGVRLLSGETLLQGRDSTNLRQDSNPCSCRQHDHCCKRAKPLHHLVLVKQSLCFSNF